MHAIVDRGELMDALDAAAKTLGTNITQATAGLLLRLDASAGQLEVITTDLQGYTHCTVPAQVKQEGETVTLSKVIPFVNRINDKDVELVLAGTNLGVKYGNHRTNFRTMDASNHPGLPSVQSAGALEIDADVLKLLIANTVAFVGNDSSKPAVTGVCLTLEPNKVAMMSTDLRRVAYWEVSGIPHNLTGSYVLFAKHIKDLIGVLPKSGTVKIQVSDKGNFMWFEVGSITKYINLISEPYPPILRILPTTPASTALVEKGALVQALERARILVEGKAEYANHFKLEISGSDIKVSGRNQDNGDIEESWHLAQAVSGIDISTALHVKFALEALSTIPGDRVEIQQMPGSTDKLGRTIPGAIRFVPEGDPVNFHLLIPFVI